MGILDQIRDNLDAQFPTKRDAYPIPVHNPRNDTHVGTGTILVTTVPQQISFASGIRKATKLTNLSSVDIYWGTNAQLISGDTGNGDLLPAGRGNWISIPHPSVIFVVVSSGSARISWAEAF